MKWAEQQADEIAQQLAERLAHYERAGSVLGSKEYVAIDSFLWNNKHNILSLLRSFANLGEGHT